MFRSWVVRLFLGAALLLPAGCKSSTPDMDSVLMTLGLKSSEPNLKPPPHPEELAAPPEDDAHFSNPVTYPDNVLNQDLVKKNPNQPGKDGPGGSPRFGSGGGGPGGGGF